MRGKKKTENKGREREGGMNGWRGKGGGMEGEGGGTNISIILCVSCC